MRRVNVKVYSRFDALIKPGTQLGMFEAQVTGSEGQNTFAKLMQELQQRPAMLPTLLTLPLGHKTALTVIK